MTVARAVAFSLIAWLTLRGDGLLGPGAATSGDHPVLVAASLGVSAVLVAGWLAVDRSEGTSNAGRRALLVALLLLLSVVGGLVSAVPIARPMIGVTIMAAVAAGSGLDAGPAAAVATSGILAVEVGALAFGSSTGDAVGWPLAVALGVLAGRNRRDAQLQRAQAAALLAQVERARAEEQRAATLDERARIAREIHDLLAHSLGALGIQLEAAQAVLTDRADVEQGVQLVGRARRLAAAGLAETRQAIDALRTDTPPLPAGLAGLVDRHEELHHTQPELIVTGAPRALPAEANLALIRTTHEALANAAKHAPAAPVSVHLEYRADATALTITDRAAPRDPAPGSGPSGDGPPAGGDTSAGYGLAGMRERLLLIGGTLTAGHDGHGCTVRAVVPA